MINYRQELQRIKYVIKHSKDGSGKHTIMAYSTKGKDNKKSQNRDKKGSK